MARRSFEMYEIRQIIVHLRLGETIRSIAQTKLANRNKIRAIRKIAMQKNWLDTQQEIPTDEVLATFFKQKPSAAVTQSSVLPYKKQIEEWCQQGIQGTTMYAALKRQHGFDGSYDAVQRFVKKIKDDLPASVTTILEFKPGECAQVDFGYGPKLVDEVTGKVTKTWIFVMVLAWSRHMYAELVLHQDVETWLGCHRRAFEFFNGVPRKIIIDNAKCAITKACYYDPVVQRSYADYAEGYGFMISACPPRDPQKKGRVESGVKYVKNNFVPLREFKSLVTGNQQLIQWVLSEAGNRIHGTTRAQPLTLFTQTEALLLQSLPDNPPECAVWEKVKLHNDCHITYLQCRYSAPYQLVQQILWLRATETTIRIYQEHTLVAVHPRLIEPGLKHTIDAHLPPNASAYV
jgi:transposase